jgi:glucosamine kinase
MEHGAIFCVDGGGTRSRGRLVDEAGRVLGESEGGPCNVATDPVRSIASLTAIWRDCAVKVGRDPASTSHVTLSIGAAGLYVRSAREAFLALCPRFARTVCLSDGYAALAGAGGGKPCGLIIAGTGAAGHRLYPDGTSTQRDAWGWVGGDRGSGAWIGRKALRHALAVCDHVRPRDIFSDRVLDALGGRAGIADRLVGVGPERLATLAPLTLAAADEGVPTAARIRARAAEHLTELAGVLDIGPGVALYMAGGLAPIFAPLVSERLGHSVLEPGADALSGCFLAAMGRAPEERMAEGCGA